MRLCRRSAVLVACLGLAVPVSAQLVFDNVAAEAGVDAYGFGRGAGWSDFDADGQLDLFALKGGQPNIVYRQRPDHTFEDVSAAWGIAPLTKHHWTCVVCDLDNDGDDDVFVGCGGFFAAETNLLYRNDIGVQGHFTDVSAQAGAATGIATPVFGSTALDFDVDGDLDLFFADITRPGFPGYCHLTRNDGNLFFTDVSHAAGVDLTGNYRHVGPGDFNDDALPDVAASNFDGGSRLFVNVGGATFTDIAPTLAPLGSDTDCFGVVLVDFDLDGWQDLFVPRWHTELTTPSGLFRNLGGVALADQSYSSGIGAHTDMGHNAFDLDNDGAPEIFIGTGSPTTPMLDVLLKITPGPAGQLVATDISLESGILAVGPTRGHGSAAADYDGDGDIDFFCNNGGMGLVAASQEYSLLYRNRGNDNAWFEVELTGVLSNRSGVGAKLSASLPDGRILRLERQAGVGFGNTDSPIQHFGIGTSTSVDRLDVRWPSGIVQTLLSPAIETRHELVETGLRLVGTPAIGSVVTLQICGSPHVVADLLLSSTAGSVAKPKYSGILQILPPYIGPFTLVLGDAGLVELPILLPLDPSLVGLTLYLQGGIHPADGIQGTVLSNLLPITFQ